MPLKINGSSSGYTEIKAADAAANNTLTLPSASGTLMTTGGSNTFTSNQIIEVTDNTNAALRITQLGTGNALVVEDSTNPDSTPFVVDASGNVGIGRSPVAKKLEVAGQIWVQDAALPATYWGNTLADYGVFQYDPSTKVGSAGVDGVATQFTIRTVGTERMRIDASGNITASGATNRYAGANQDAAWLTASGTVVTLLCGDSGGSGNGIFQYNRASGGILVRAGGSGGVSLGAGGTSWSAVSDERAKDIIEPITDAASKVSTLRAVIGKYKDDESEKRRSFLIAQDVQKVLPEAIDTTNPDNLGLAYTDVIPLLTAALQEALTKIDALETRIATLEAI